MEIVGYTDRLSVPQGGKIRFMVSCELPSYRADIVRLIHGDVNPKGPGFKEELIQTPVQGEYTGRKQVSHKGSYVVVHHNPLLQPATSFTLQCWIFSTTPQKGVQGILTKGYVTTGAGYGLFLDDSGGVALWIADGAGHVERFASGKPLRASEWYFVTASYDGKTGKVYLSQEPLSNWPQDDSRAVIEGTTTIRELGNIDSAFLMGARWEQADSGQPIVSGYYNGKIDSPQLFSRALTGDEIESLKTGASPKPMGDDLVAAWDFSLDISSTKVTDVSPHGLHGHTVNMPTRAMTGHHWTGTELNFNRAANQYGAIYFHDDDRDDAGWEVDFELHVPDDMKSGVYAARLRAGDNEDYIPFFVRPKKGTSSARIVFLAPTLSYLAYGNAHLVDNPSIRAQHKRMEEIPYPTSPQDHYIVGERLNSTYDYHTDGSGVCHVSRLQPIVNMRPKYATPWLDECPHQFNADLHLLDWMEAKGHKFDVVTDEDLHFEGEDLLSPYRVVVTGSHPEYYSGAMLTALQRYLNGGGRLMYLGGNGFYWVTSIHPERRHIIEVRRWGGTRTWEAAPGEGHHSGTGEPGGIWRLRGQAPQKTVGIGFTAQGVDRNSPYDRKPDSLDPRAAFIFEGIGADEPIGDFDSLVLQHGAAGFELDRAEPAFGTPPHSLVLASSSGHSDAYQHVVEEVLQSNSLQKGTVNPLVRADMVYIDYPNGGAVFSVGSISWCGSLSYNSYDNNVSRVTDNVLRGFAAEAIPH